MPLAQLRIDFPEGTWINEVSTAYPDATFEVLAVIPDDDVGIALIELTTPELAEVVRTMAHYPQLLDMEPVQQGDDHAIVRIETNAPLLLLAAQASGIPIELPVTIQDGEATVEFRASADRLSELGDELERFGFSYTVEILYENPVPETLLSERERDLLLSAVKHGYYDTPRTCSLTELAETVGIAKSTCSETLHRAESVVITRFVEQHLEPSIR